MSRSLGWQWSVGTLALNGMRVALVALLSVSLGRSAATVVRDHESILSSVAYAIASWAFALRSLFEPR